MNLRALVFVATVSGCGRLYPAAPPGERVRDLAGDARADALPRSFELVVWNVHKASHRDWPEDFRGLIQTADLVLIQEAITEAAFTGSLAARPELEWTFGTSFVYARRDSLATGVATASVADPIAASVLHAPKYEPFGTPKAALLTEYALEGRDDTLLVVNLHGINFRRAAHLAHQLAPIGHALMTHEGPAIVAGDFNTHHRPRMDVVRAFAARYRLIPAFGDAKDGRARFGRWPLDHVYVRDLKITHARVHKDVETSDHAPLRVRLSAPRSGRPRSGPSVGR